jgi:FAD/FMN-containing dehydrogenase/Fe-S oxidoreductase
MRTMTDAFLWSVTKERFQETRMPEKRGQTKLEINIDALERDLRSTVDGEVRFDTSSRALYASDASNYRQVPIGVVLPRTTDAVVRTVSVCSRHGAPLLSRGAGTSLCGQACNVAVVIDHSKYLDQVLEIDGERRLARVQPGVVLDRLRDRAIREHGLTFGPDPATHTRCTLGGMIGNNSRGIRSTAAGATGDNVEQLDVVTYAGVRMKVGPTDDGMLGRIISAGGRQADIYLRLRDLRDRYGHVIRRKLAGIPGHASGYALDALLPENGFNVARALVGSEGTCVTVLEATLTLVPGPPESSLLVLGYPDIFTAGDHVQEILRHAPTSCEGIDDQLVHFMEKKGAPAGHARLLPPGKGWLVVEFGGRGKEEAAGRARACMDSLARTRQPPAMKLCDAPGETARIWALRESGLGAAAHVPGLPLSWPGWEDSAVPPDKLGPYLRDFRRLLDEFGLTAALFGHFGQGCIHCRISFDLFTREGIADTMRFLDRATDLVLSYGGSFSAEHGDGQARALYLPRLYGAELMSAFREFKAIWDPDNKMNPGKLVYASGPDENLRLGPDYRPWQPQTMFKFPEDKGSFPAATLRCAGIGKCREPYRAFMCPSFIATRDEMHTTRGRARLLFEMFKGDLITDGWKSREVRDSLELCLGCKACKNECPVNVDLASYRSEFLSHYYARRIRPRAHYAMGSFGYWGPWAARVPWLANFCTQTFGLRTLTKLACGYALKRRVPRFASRTFSSQFRDRPRGESGEQVLLVPDLYNDCFFPETLSRAANVLRRMGFQVLLPERPIREVRPLLHYGMLDRAVRELRKAMNTLRGYASRSIPILFLEPSTASVYRDDMLQLFPGDQDAVRIRKQSYLLGEFIEARNLDVPQLRGKALFHAHCHQKAVLDPGAVRSLLRRMGLDVEEPDPGCCGMAGSFGLESSHYDVSRSIGQENLLPAVSQASRTTYIVADGFSCRSQILEGTSRKPLHLAELLYAAFEAVGSAYEADHLTIKPREKEHEIRKAA